MSSTQPTPITPPAVADVLTPEEFRAALPDKMKKSVNQALIDQVNQTLAQPELYEQYRENLIGYASVLNDGKYKVSQYISAVKYCSYKIMGKTSKDAYALTFPDKIKRFAAEGVVAKDIASYTTAYNKGKLVQAIMAQSMTPTWVLNQDLYQRALNTQAEIMVDDGISPMARTAAANSLITALKPPEIQKVELDIGVKPDSSIAQLRDATLALAAQQRAALKAGAVDAQEIAHSSVVIEGESEEVL